MNELYNLTLKQAKEGLTSKKFSALELTKSYLDRIDKFNKKLNAFTTVCKEYSLEKAIEADKKMALGLDLPLLGIPIAIKDMFVTKGIRTTAAAKVLENYIPQYSATTVNKLTQVGAIIIGKTNCDAWAHGSSGENSDFNPARNPWNIDYVPGGSSSGSGVAISAAMAPVAMGTDTGGSVRLPASFTSTVGIKPSYGRVSRYGIIAMTSSLDSIGHITKTVYDNALVLSITAGKDENDATTFPNNVPNYLQEITNNPSNLKIGIPEEYFGEGLSSTVRERVMNAVEKFKSLGYLIQSVKLPLTKAALAVYYIIVSSEVSSNLARYDGIRYGRPRDDFGDEAKRRIMLGTYTLSTGYYDAYYLKAAKVRTLIKQEFDQVFTKVDLILGPVSPTPPFKIGEKSDDPLAMYLSDVLTVPINLAGLPALSLPCGFSEKGLPIGMQLIGPQLSESLLYRIGYHYQRETDWHEQFPKL